ncbi:unnamed protein product [Ambrosiozyma monospora]|uniref:Mitochondrial distribution and morphology protein 10 n=1 Tax=Ambrosiozyma monospora TaxID=43982 RepID=A0A9W6YVP8_AMBMO|nr:unnamed protein product [Ambrosiozyma monospora]
MLEYPDYIQRCFYQCTSWDPENSYDDVLRTSKNLLSFTIPSGFKFCLSAKNSEYSYSSLSIAQFNRVTASLAYMYSSVDMTGVYQDSTHLPLQSLLQSYRFVQPHSANQWPFNGSNLRKGNERPYMMYGKMYFPSQFLEGMLIKRLSNTSQIIVKFISSPKLQKLANPASIISLQFQRQTPSNSMEFIFSSKDALTGFRYLYNFGTSSNQHTDNSNSNSNSSSNSHAHNNHNYNHNHNRINSSLDSHNQDTNHNHQHTTTPQLPTESSLLSLGCELWFAPYSMSPGLSTALRYSTHLTSSGKPLTITLALNPLLGTVESTYAIKTDINSTFCSKYSFNLYSYESDLSLGVNFLRFATRPPFFDSGSDSSIHENSLGLNALGNATNEPSIPGLLHVTDSDSAGSGSGSGSGSNGTATFNSSISRSANSGSSNPNPSSTALSVPHHSHSADGSGAHPTPYSPLQAHNSNRSSTSLSNKRKQQQQKQQQQHHQLNDEQHEQLMHSFLLTTQTQVANSAATHFISSFNNSNFQSSFKATMSLSKKDLLIAWEGKFKDCWCLSSGVSLGLGEFGQGSGQSGSGNGNGVARLIGYGVEFQYGSGS